MVHQTKAIVDMKTTVSKYHLVMESTLQAVRTVAKEAKQITFDKVFQIASSQG